MARPAPALATALLFLALATTARAGGYRGRPHVPVPDDASSYLNHAPAATPKHPPKQFSWGDVDGRHLLVPSWNQHEPVYCGSCWAHASLSMLSDRLKIAKGGVGPDVMLSRQTLLNCAALKGYGGGCDGGDPIDVFRYMAKFGLPDESCLTYSATDHSKYAAIGLTHCAAGGFCVNCMPAKGGDTCWPVKTPILYRVTAFGRVGSPDGVDAHGPGANVAAMQAELLARGPIVCSIATPDALVYGYRGGIFDDRNSSTRDDVDHDVEVVGYGVEGGVPYWLIRNSWGTYVRFS